MGERLIDTLTNLDNSNETVNIGTNESGVAVSIGHTTSETTVNDNLNVTGDVTTTGTTTLTGNLVAPKMSPFYTAVAKTANFTAEAGKCYLVTKVDGCAITLPAPTVGAKIKLVLGGITSGNHVITTDAATTLYNGYALLSDTADGTAAEHIVFAPNGTSDVVITLDGSTKGLSGTIELTGTSATTWFCEAVLCASGTIVTPFA